MDNLLGSKSFMYPVCTVSSTGKRSYIPSTSSTSSIDSLNTDEKVKHSKLMVLYE